MMFFSKSVALDHEDPNDVASAARLSTAYADVENRFIEKLRLGDSEAFDSLVCRYSGDIFALLYRLTQDPDEARDLTQETFLSALTAITSFRGESEIKTWLFRIAVNHSRNRFRWWKRRRRDRTVSLDEAFGDSDIRVGDNLADIAESPEATALRRERECLLLNALASLPFNNREAVVLCDIEGLSYDEIADALDINIGTVKSRIARGREELRRRLKDF